MDLNRSLEANLDDLKKMTIKLADSGEELFEENQAIILLNFVPYILKDVKNAL